MLIGEQMAEQIKLEIGSAAPMPEQAGPRSAAAT